VNVVRSI